MTHNESTIRDLPQTPSESQNVPVERKKSIGAFIRRRELVTIIGETIFLPDPEWYVHLQFRRFAVGSSGQRSVRFRKKGDRLCRC